MKKPKYYILKVNRFLTFGMWNPDLQLGKYKQKVLEHIQVASYMLKTFKEEKIGLQSASLSYFVFMSVVPFLAFAFAITGGLGLDNVLMQLLTDNLSDYPVIIDTIMEAANKIINTSQSGMFGLFSALLFLWLVIWMMMCVERVFNSAWKIKENRKFYKRLSVIFVILILSPFMILLFSTGTIMYSNVLDFLVPNSSISDSFKSFLGWVIFGVIAIAVISAMFKFIPNTKVYYKNAFKSAVITGIAFTVLQYLYIETQLLVSRLSSIYGTVAAIPLFMVWMRMGWLIIMYGCETAYAFQNIDKYRGRAAHLWEKRQEMLNETGKNISESFTPKTKEEREEIRVKRKKKREQLRKEIHDKERENDD